MSTQKYVSDIKTINWSNKIVYDKLSDLSFLNKLFSPEAIDRIKTQMGDNAPDINVDDFYADKDSCSFAIPKLGYISFYILEREEPKTIKIISDSDTKFNFKFWIQLLPKNQNQTKMRITLHIELDAMTKMMLGKKISKGINQIADGISQIPFGMI